MNLQQYEARMTSLLLANVIILYMETTNLYWHLNRRTPHHVLSVLRSCDFELIVLLRFAKRICDEQNDVATARLIDKWIVEIECRSWFRPGAGAVNV